MRAIIQQIIDDLAFDCDVISQREWLDILDTLEKTTTLLKIDAIHYNASSDELRAKIDQEGITIYEELALRIDKDIKQYHPEMKIVFSELQQRFS